MDITIDCVKAARKELEQLVNGEEAPTSTDQTPKLKGPSMYRRRRNPPNPIVESLRRTIRYLRTGNYDQSI